MDVSDNFIEGRSGRNTRSSDPRHTVHGIQVSSLASEMFSLNASVFKA